MKVNAEFQCRACGHLSPLNHLDLDGSVRCLRCGLDQAFAETSWQKALAHAHAVADLAGAPEGRKADECFSIEQENPFRAGPSALYQESGFVLERGMQIPSTMRLYAELGEPRCEPCGGVLQLDARAADLHLRCTHCNDARVYRLPPEALRLSPGLVAVIQDEHRSDQLVTRVEESTSDPGVVALRCPSCGGGLQVRPGTRVVTCTYCRTSSRIPQKTLLRTGDPNVQKEAWWLAFQGPSPLRRKLERDPRSPREPGDELTDIKVREPDKAKRPRGLDLALVIALPLLLLAFAGLLDLFVLEAFELDLPL